MIYLLPLVSAARSADTLPSHANMQPAPPTKYHFYSQMFKRTNFNTEGALNIITSRFNYDSRGLEYSVLNALHLRHAPSHRSRYTCMLLML